MKPDPQDLEKIARLTLEHYNQRAEEFWEGTRDHDVGQNIAALLQYIDSKPPFTILDFGCGPGRDLNRRSDKRAPATSAPRSAADKNPGRIINHTRIHLAPSVNHSFSGLR